MARKPLSIDDVGKNDMHPFVEETINRTSGPSNYVSVDTRGFVNNHVEPAPPTSPYEEIPVITREEALLTIASEIHHRVKENWIYDNDTASASPEERIMGAVETVLDVLQHGTSHLPPFNLVATYPTYYEEPQSYAYNADGNMVPRRFQEGQVIELGGSVADGDAMLTASFSQVYDAYKRRMWASSKDLFNTLDKIDRQSEED